MENLESQNFWLEDQFMVSNMNIMLNPKNFMNKILWNFMNFWRILTYWHFINLFLVTNKNSTFSRFKIFSGRRKICEILFLRFFFQKLASTSFWSVKVVFRKSKFLACRFFEIWPIKWPCLLFSHFCFLSRSACDC